MYRPTHDGMQKAVGSVRYLESQPPSGLAGLVHCFWELKTLSDLPEDYCYHALPDACVNILFNQIDPGIAGLTALRTRAEVLNLGRAFHYVGIQLYPGVWQGTGEELIDRFVGTRYEGRLPLRQVGQEMSGLEFERKVPALAALVQWLLKEEMVSTNILTEKVLTNLDQIRSVGDMAKVAGTSPRHLQRTVRRLTGMSPHDLLKVLRVQQSFRSHYLDLYADQSHYIHSFRKVTGYTPAKFAATFEAPPTA
jgi:AraC-like DNA-binding protein